MYRLYILKLKLLIYTKYYTVNMDSIIKHLNDKLNKILHCEKWKLICCQDFESLVSRLSRPRVFRQSVETVSQYGSIIKHLNDKLNQIVCCE